MSQPIPDGVVSLDVDSPVWDRFFTVAPLVLIGSREADGRYDLAPKHMVTPLGWQNYFGFVCTPRHATYQNIQRAREFTVTYPKPNQVLFSSLAAECRDAEDVKPALQVLPTFAAQMVDGVFVADGYLFFECRLNRVVDGFGVNSLLVGRIVAAHVDQAALRASERDDNDLIRQQPLLAYLSPGRFTEIQNSHSFPFPAEFRR